MATQLPPPPPPAPVPPPNSITHEKSETLTTARGSSSSVANAPTLQQLFTSASRVTLASVCGVLVGLGQSMQQQQQQSSLKSWPSTTTATKQQRLSHLSLAGGRKSMVRPPPRPTRHHALLPRHHHHVDVARKWAVSCMLFALVLETCRLCSPTTRMVESTAWLLPRMKETHAITDAATTTNPFFTTIADYSIGGAVAGFAGAQRAQQGRRTSLTLGWGLRMGLALGVLAGLSQATLDWVAHRRVMTDAKNDDKDQR